MRSWFYFGLLAVAGCSASIGSGGVRPDARSNEALVTKAAVPARPFDVLRGDKSVPDSSTFANAVDVKTLYPPAGAPPAATATVLPESGSRRPLVVVQSSPGPTGGQAGTAIDAAPGPTFAPYTGIYDAQDFYTSGVSTSHVLYAPTLRGAGGDCLEITSVYGFGSSPALGVWDFCDANTGQKSMWKVLKYVNADPNFGSKYIRNFGDGLPAITVESYLSSDGNWHAILYNYSSGNYEELTNTVGDVETNDPTSRGAGWAQFETHYSYGDTCTQIPSISAGGVRYRDASGNWNLLGTGPLYSTQHSFSYGDCFDEDDYGNPVNYGPNPYVINFSDGNGGTGISRWVVTGGQ